MLLKEGNNSVVLDIKTGINFYTAIYRRRYILDVHVIRGGQAMISVRSVDYTPSGYIEGGKDQLLMQCEEVKIPQDLTAKEWLAQLVLRLDKTLTVKTRCQYLNESRKEVYGQLEEIGFNNHT